MGVEQAMKTLGAFASRLAHDRHIALVVDDDASVRSLLGKFLSRLGLEVEEASDGEGAMGVLRASLPCLVLVDVGLPGMSGIELCRALRERDEARQAIIILISGADSAVEEGIAAGATDFIRKPFVLNDLRLRILAHLRLHEARLVQERLRMQLQALTATSTAPLVVLDRDGRIEDWPRYDDGLFGYRAEDAKGQRFDELLFRGEERKTIAEAVTRVATDDSRASIPLVVWNRIGEDSAVEITITPVRVGGRTSLVVAIEELHWRRAIEAQLRETEAIYQASFEAAPVGLVVLDGDSRIVRTNDAFARMMGCLPPELIGTPWPSLIAEEERVAAFEGWAQLLVQRKAATRVERQLSWRSGKSIWVDINAAPLLDADGKARQVFVHAVDISQRKVVEEQAQREADARARMEVELRHSQKLEAIGSLAAGIAHELNTPAQYVSDNVAYLSKAFDKLGGLVAAHERLLAELKSGPLPEDQLRVYRTGLEKAKLARLMAEVPAALSEALEGLSRVATIVRAMKEFSHPSGGVSAPASLRDIIQTTVIVCRNEWKYVAELTTDFLEDMPLVPCFRDELGQVVLNLVVNAAHAIDAGLSKDATEKGKIHVSTHLHGDWAEIRVRDTGIGMTEETKKRIFDPFFTTKPVGKGSGQGLAIAHRVIERHHGRIEVESAVGRGTTFRIFLPVAGCDVPIPPSRTSVS